jgi:hypothetical protein
MDIAYFPYIFGHRVQRLLCGDSLEVKRPNIEADNSSPSRAGVKNF